MTHTTWELIEQRKMLKQRLNQTQDTRGKLKRQKEYWSVNKGVKKSAREDKRKLIQNMAEEAEQAAGQNNMKRLYEITRTLSGKNANHNKPIRDKNGKLITNETEQGLRWIEHFKSVLNRPPPTQTTDIPPT